LLDVGDIQVRIESRVKECQYGLYGEYSDNADYQEDCWWRRYTPELPLFELNLFNRADLVYELYPWTCYYYEYDEDDIDAS